MTKDLDTETRILEAAKSVFVRKGYAGARMQEIADSAGINKGLLHYYFKSKDNLFFAIFKQGVEELAEHTNVIFESDLPLITKLEQFVDHYLDFLTEHPYLPSFIIQEMNRHPDTLVQNISGWGVRPNPMKLMMQIQVESGKGLIRPIHPVHLVVNVLSMCVFPYVARPMMQAMLQVSDADYLQFMKDRKNVVLDFVKNALWVKGEE